MTARFTQRYVNQLTGVFVLLALLAVAGGVFLAGRAHRWFEPTISFSLLLPEEGSFGLKPGAAVIVMGTDVGEINDIRVRADNRMTARMTVRRDFVRFIDTNSRATIKKTFGMAGDSFVEISCGLQRGRPLADNAMIETAADRTPNEMLREIIDQMRTEVMPAVREIRLAADRTAKLATGLNDPDRPVLKTIKTINAIATKIDSGEGLANRILTDRKMADNVGAMIERANATLDQTQAMVKEFRAVTAQVGKSTRTLDQTIEQLPQTMRQVNATLEDVRKISGNLIRATAAMPATVENINQEVKSLAGLVTQTQATLREIQRLVKGAQRHWFIRGYVAEDRPQGRIAPQEVIVPAP